MDTVKRNRDMGLVRLILLRIEGEEVDLSKYSKDAIYYNKHILIEAGFIDGKLHKVNGKFVDESINGLTWEGHDFLDSARNEKVWTKSMKKVGSTVGTVPLEVLKAVLIATAKEYLGLS